MLAEHFGHDWLKIDLPFACEVHHCYPRAQPDPSRFRVLLHTAEPAPLKWAVEHVRAHHQAFDLILTSERQLLDLPNALFLIFGDAWTTTPPPRKEFALSYLWSAGIGAPWDGYGMRQKLWDARQQIQIPKNFWYSQRRPPKTIEAGDQMFTADGKDILFESMFSIIVENIRETDYFTEKILDALQTYTVPIYFGCPNITEYFDERGLILFADEADFVQKVNQLTPADYWDRMPFVLENRARSMAYKDGVGRVREAIHQAYFTRHQGALVQTEQDGTLVAA